MSATIFTTFVERESCFVKVWGQKEKQTSLYIENALMHMKPQFDAGAGVLREELIQPGRVCCAKYNDDSYYRARVVSVAMLRQRVVEVMFIDYGNRDLVKVENLRAIDSFPAAVSTMPGQAKDFVLAKVQLVNANGTFLDPGFEAISSEIRYLDFEFLCIGQVGPYSLLSLTAGGRDVAESFVMRQLAHRIDVSMQLLMLQSLLKIPAMAMPQQQVPAMMAHHSPPPMHALASNPTSPPGQPTLLTFKTLSLKVGSEHTVYVSYVTDGPCLFSIQLQNKESELQELMFELNKLPLIPIEESILPGFVCLARSSEDNYICRAVVTSQVDGNYKVFFVDFGNTEMRSFDNLFQIPFKYVIPKVMATRFGLHGLHGQVVSLDMKVAFKNFVDNQVLKMRVCTPLPKTGLLLCELWNAEGVSALDYVRGASLHGYPDPVVLTRGFNQEVKVSFVFSCVKFYVQLRKKEAELVEMMSRLQAAPMSPIAHDKLKPNAPCIALYAEDGQYYRAQILDVRGGSALVRYVDYGNEEDVPVANVRAPMMEFITNLRPQAIECCLNGYQNMGSDPERDLLLEGLILEQCFTMKVADVQGSRILVDLFDAQMYNVASLLLDKMAKTRSQVSPALVQDNKIDQRKTATTIYASRNNKTDTWRDKERSPRSPPDDWRQGKANDDVQSQNPAESNNEYRRKIHSSTLGDKNGRNNPDGEANAFPDRRKQNWSNNRERPPRESSWGKADSARSPRNNEWGGAGGDRDSESSWSDKGESRRQNNWGGGDRREGSREKSWGDGFDNRRERDNNRRDRNDFSRSSPRSDSRGGGDGGDKSRSSPRRRRGAGSEDGSEKSFSSGKSFKSKRDNFGGSPPKKSFDESVDYAEPTERFAALNLAGSERKVSVSWFHNPGNFFVQPANDKAKFEQMMRDIQFAYKKRKCLDAAEAGSIVIAQFPEDNVLYRGVIAEVPLAGSYKVLYVDFGNTAMTNKIYKVERRFMELPAQAAHCGLQNVRPVGQHWPKADDFGKFFGEDVMDCKFDYSTNDIYAVDIISKGQSIKEELQKAGLVLVKNPYEHFDVAYLVSQQIYCKINCANALNDLALEILPGLTVSCTVFKHEHAAAPNLGLLQQYVNCMVVAYVDDVRENKVFVTLYDTRGHFLPVIELQEEMFDVVSPICPTLIIGPRLSGYVAHATPAALFVQADYSAKNVDLLLEQLFALYDASECQEFAVKEIVYAAKSTDGNWYRGLVKKIEGDDVTVQYIDYGNEEVIAKSALRVLGADFFTPYLAAEVHVDNAEQYIDQDVNLKVVFGEEHLQGEVINDGKAPAVPETALDVIEEVKQEHVVEPVAVEEIPPEVATKEEGKEAQEKQARVENGFAVALSHFDNPGQFYLVQESAFDEVTALQEELQKMVPTMTDIENITTGIICAAPYSVDDVWYRAQVLDVDADITTVRFIDYGNTDVIRSDVRIKTLPPALLSLEEHAKRCSLFLTPAHGEWSSEACKRFEDLAKAARAAITAEIVHQDEKTTFVKLFVDNICVNDVFMQEGLATEMQEAPAALTAFVSNLNSPSEFWLQYESACNDLEWVADQLAHAETFKQLEDQAPGSLCAAIFPEDESWYRARILSNTVAGVEVLFIDYGNSCTSTSLRGLPEDLVIMPPLAHKCSLVKPSGILEWSADAVEKFKEVSADGVTVFTVIKHAQGETNQVKLMLSGEDVSERLKPELFDARIIRCNGLGDFSIRKAELQAKFAEIQGKIQELPDKPGADEVIVAALHENVFYRAKINGAIVDKFVVDLLDLGVEVDVTELRQLPQDVADVEPLAANVKMNPVVGFVFNAVSETHFKALCESERAFQVELVTEKIVNLYLNGCDIRKKMPSTKCTPMSSVHSTPKRTKADNVADDSDVGKTAHGEVDASPILLSKTGIGFEDSDVTMKTVEITDVNMEQHPEADESKEDGEEKIKQEECGLSLEEEMKQVVDNMITECTKTTDNRENGKENIEIKKENEEVSGADDELIKDAEMITSVTDELVDKVAKQCNLLSDVASVSNGTAVNGADEKNEN